MKLSTVRDAGSDWTDWLYRGAVALCIAAALFAVGLASFMVWREFQPHQTIELDARDWHCAETRSRLMPTIVGKTTVMIPRRQCVAYRRAR